MFKGGIMRANVLVVFGAALLVSGSAAAQTTALTHATVIDGTGAAPQHDVTIVMENGTSARHRAIRNCANTRSTA
jgi:hypothetical protein